MPWATVVDKQGFQHSMNPAYLSIDTLNVAAGDRIVLQTNAPRFVLLFDCGTWPGAYSPCDFTADTPGNLPGEVRVNDPGGSAILDISRADNWGDVRADHAPQRYPADPVLRIGFSH